MNPQIAEENVAHIVGAVQPAEAFRRRGQIAHIERHLRIAEIERGLLRVRRFLIVLPDELAARSS